MSVISTSAPAGCRVGTSSPVVKNYDASCAPAWDGFVSSVADGTFFHLSPWSGLLQQTFCFEPCHLYAETEGAITGVLPLYRVRNWIMGDALISTPFTVYGGVCAADPASAEALVSHAIAMAEARGVDYLELRDRDAALRPDFHHNSRYVAFWGPLSKDPEAGLKKLPRDTRYMIRRAEKNGLTLRHGMEQLPDFYRLFAISLHRLGTPVFPKRWIEALAQTFSHCSDLSVVYSGEEPVCGVLSFLFRDTILPYYVGAQPLANKLAGNNFMYWELMKWAAGEGYATFDFGRSKKGTGAYAFKSQWGLAVKELDYQVRLVRRKTVPDFSPLNPKLGLAVRAWQKLPPIVANNLGPHVIRWFA
jgi:FemAB-related protein (PEP-CTERM system-associated)